MAITEAPLKPPQHKEVEQFTDAERAAWLKDGTMPLLEEEKVPPKEDASAASIPVKDAGSGPAKKDKPDQERNWRALESERDSLKAAREAAENELKEWREGKRKPEENKADAGPKLLEMPVRPKMKDFTTEGGLDSDKYEAALDKYENDKTAYINQQTQIRTAAQQQDQSIKTWQTELKTKYGEKSDGIDVKKTVDALAGTLRDAPAFFMFLNDSDVFTDLLFVLGTDPKLDELLSEAKAPKTVTRAIRKLVALEAGVKAELAKQAKKPAGEEEPAKKDNLTKAGKPPSEAAGGSASSADDGSSDYVMKNQKQFGKDWGEVYRERRNKEERAARKKKIN